MSHVVLRQGDINVVVSIVGVLLLLEAARRAVGPALAIIASLMLVYIFAGPWLPGK